LHKRVVKQPIDSYVISIDSCVDLSNKYVIE